MSERRDIGMRMTIALLPILLLLTLASAVIARPGAREYDLFWQTVDGGGGKSTTGTYALSGTAGQAEVGPLMQGGAYELAGGFWVAAGQAEHGIYLPVVLRVSP